MIGPAIDWIKTSFESATVWLNANYGWLHLLFCCAALIYCANKTKVVWHIPAFYLLVMLVSYPYLYKEMGPVKFYFSASVFELFLIWFMYLFRHPMATYIGTLSCAALVFHLLSLSAYFWLVSFDVFGHHLTPLYDAKQAHRVVIPLLESFQVVSIFVFSSPKFQHLDKPIQDKEPATWQAMSIHQ